MHSTCSKFAMAIKARKAYIGNCCGGIEDES